LRRTTSAIPGLRLSWLSDRQRNRSLRLSQSFQRRALSGFAGSHIELGACAFIAASWKKFTSFVSTSSDFIDAMIIVKMLSGQDSRTEFQRSGTYHVLVVSGMNVAILAFVVFWILRRMNVSDLVAAVLTVGLSVAYAFLTDVALPSGAPLSC